MDKIDPSSNNSGGMPSGGGSPQLNMDPSDLLDVTCNECDSNVFQQVYFIKKISEVISPNGEEGLFPVPSFRCAECGHINEEFKDFDKE